jgi:hypothetical protein
LLSFKLGYGIAGLAMALAADELLRGILNLSRWCLNEPARSL